MIKDDILDLAIAIPRRFYQHEKAMYMEEYNPQRYNWLEVDNADQSIFAFERNYDGEVLVFVFNMTPNYYEYINIPMLTKGTYEEIFNSDKDVYAGRNNYNGLPLTTEDYGYENKPYHLTIKLASFGACIFKKVK